MQNEEIKNETPENESVPTENQVQEPEIKELSLEEQLKESQESYKRLYAEFDNFRKRSQKEKSEWLKYAEEGVIKQLLPVLDDFERAMANNEKTSDVAVVKEGFQLIYNKMSKTLQDRGLLAVDSQGAIFDTEFHEAITEFPAMEESQKGKVIDTAEKGYTLNGKIIRYAKVVVGK
jgi:molecular chaperone GrpE